MQTAGVVLDVYDDVSGHVLSSIFGPEGSGLRKTAAVELPPLLKTASLLPLERYAQVPDRNFALILHNGGEPLRKYAMHDSAHLTLSTLYFLECGHLLPKEAQAVAANNLVQAHSWYDSKPPAALQKVADLIGTEVMPRGTLRGKSIRVNPSKHVSTASKVASASFTDPNVDVQHLAPPAREVAYEPTHTCLQGQYPIDSYEQIKTAEEYFDEYAHELSPLDRREFAVSLTKRAGDLGIPISGRALDYSGSNFGPHILAEIEKRAANFSGDPQGDVYTTLKKKVASGQVSPDMTAAALYQADTAFGLDQAYGKAVVGFRDPIEAVYGQEKVAHYKNDATDEYPDDKYTWSRGSDYATGDQIRHLSRSTHLMEGVLDDKVQTAFGRDPVTVFKSLPEPQKHALARLATLASNGRTY